MKGGDIVPTGRINVGLDSREFALRNREEIRSRVIKEWTLKLVSAFL